MDIAAVVDLQPFRDDMERVDSELRRSVEGEHHFFNEVTAHLLNAGGKRLRPALVLCAAYASQSGPCVLPAADRVIAGAASMELLHLGSLYHDDVMDEADLRRGVVSANARWGNVVAVLGGDQLLARASVIAAALGTAEGRLVASTLEELCVGQALETRDLYDTGRTEEAYHAAIDGKTAALMAASCTMGALEAGAGAPRISGLAAFGRRLGTAFQILDDVLDLVGEQRDLGKPVGNDAAEGVYTLPVILSMRRTPDLRAALGGRNCEPDTARIRETVISDGSIEAGLRTAEADLAAARESLVGLSCENGALEAMGRLAARLLDPVSRCITRPQDLEVLSAAL